jgi:hypothetical protein
MTFPTVSAFVGVTAKSTIWGAPRLASADETDVGEGRGGGRVAAGGRRVGVSARVGTDVGEASGDEKVRVALDGLRVGGNVGDVGVAAVVGSVERGVRGEEPHPVESNINIVMPMIGCNNLEQFTLNPLYRPHVISLATR